MYLAAAEKQGIRLDQLRGTTQNDILKEFIAQKEFIFPPEPSMRLVVDTMEFGAQKVPQWNTISISGYHIREAGSTAAQELAFTLADGLEYVRWGIARGMDVDEFAPRLSFFFNAHNDFFEEIAKYRAQAFGHARCARHSRRKSAFVVITFPYADGRRLTYRATTRKQCCACGHTGSRCRPRRHAKSAHKFVR
jgi:methylmalonyl-CoA mutase N-terminal domain/subunit